MSQKEIQRQFEAIWKRLDETSKTASDATILARHADKGFIEVTGNMKTMNAQVEQQNVDINRLGSKFDSFTETVRDKLTKNLLWTIGFIFSLLTLYSALIIYVLTRLRQ